MQRPWGTAQPRELEEQQGAHVSHGAVSEGGRGEGKEVTGQVRQGPVAITTWFFP